MSRGILIAVVIVVIIGVAAAGMSYFQSTGLEQGQPESVRPE
ncbi:hypothetical protein [Devosia aurantiaca]|nr:hypothetical protein [Devosia aurantiaca]